MGGENSKNHTTRVGEDFSRDIQKMNDKRIELGRKKLSIRLLTNILIKHNSWPIIIDDLINLNLQSSQISQSRNSRIL